MAFVEEQLRLVGLRHQATEGAVTAYIQPLDNDFQLSDKHVYLGN